MIILYAEAAENPLDIKPVFSYAKSSLSDLSISNLLKNAFALKPCFFKVYFNFFRSIVDVIGFYYLFFG